MINGTATSNLIDGISFTFPQDAKLPAELRGITATGGRPEKHAINGKITQVVAFETKINGKKLVMIVAGKPALEFALQEYFDAEIKREADNKAALELAVPGIHEILALSSEVANDNNRYNYEFNCMMENEYNDGAKPPKNTNASKAEKLQELLKTHPRAAMYLKAKHQENSASWADNSGKGQAGQKAMEILANGGSLEDAKTAMEKRCEFND